MDLLNSDWLIHMLDKSSHAPKQRLINLFSILNDWLDAPSLDIHQIELKPDVQSKLVPYLSTQAAKAGIEMPEMLASQLYFMALAAAQEKTLHQNPQSLLHAQLAAKALIEAQSKPAFYKNKFAIYAMAATILTFGLVGLLLNHSASTSAPPSLSKASYKSSQPHIIKAKHEVSASPAQTAALFAKIEQMRKGDCQLIEALQLPDAYKKVYFENIVSGQISTSQHDQKIVHELLEKVRCNYTPMLMANSK